MNTKRKLWSGLASFVFLLTGCASTAHIEKDETTDFSTYKTFAWVTNDNVKEKNNNHKESLAEQRLKQAVGIELEKSAQWKETKKNPDILLSYDVLVERGVKQHENPVYSVPYSRLIYNPYRRRYFSIYYPSRFVGYERDERPIKEGTVTISMVDAKTNKTVWQGWTTDEVNNRNLTSKEIQVAVRSIFKKFDIAKN